MTVSSQYLWLAIFTLAIYSWSSSLLLTSSMAPKKRAAVQGVDSSPVAKARKKRADGSPAATAVAKQAAAKSVAGPEHPGPAVPPRVIGINATFFAEIAQGTCIIKAHGLFSDVVTAAGLNLPTASKDDSTDVSIGAGVNAVDFKKSMAVSDTYCASGNLWLVDLQSTPLRSSPINRHKITDLQEHFFSKPTARMPYELILAVKTGQDPSTPEWGPGLLNFVSAPEVRRWLLSNALPHPPPNPIQDPGLARANRWPVPGLACASWPGPGPGLVLAWRGPPGPGLALAMPGLGPGLCLVQVWPGPGLAWPVFQGMSRSIAPFWHKIAVSLDTSLQRPVSNLLGVTMVGSKGGSTASCPFSCFVH